MSLNDELTRLHDAIGRNKIIPTPDITPVFTGGGVELILVNRSLPASSSSSSNNAVQAVVGSGSVSAGFAMTYYANGWDQASTGSGTGWPADLAIGDTVDSGEQVMTFITTATTTGDSE